MPVKYPKAVVRLTKINGNAFVIIGATTAALKDAGASQGERAAFLAEATSGDYDRLLQTVRNWVTVE